MPDNKPTEVEIAQAVELAREILFNCSSQDGCTAHACLVSRALLALREPVEIAIPEPPNIRSRCPQCDRFAAVESHRFCSQCGVPLRWI